MLRSLFGNLSGAGTVGNVWQEERSALNTVTNAFTD